MKKIISLLLTLIIIVNLTLPLVSANSKCNCDFSPVIYVAALGSAKIYSNYGTENEKLLFRPDTNELVSNAINMLLPTLPQVFIGKYDNFTNSLVSFVNKTFGDLALDGDGNSKDFVFAVRDLPKSGEHGIDKSYYFGYDLRLDPFTHADDLHECIQIIKKLTGHDKVQLKASSMGGVVTMAYLQRYGTSDLETVIFQNCPILGTAVAGELFCKKVEVNKNALLNYALDAIPSLENDFLQGFLISLAHNLDSLGVWKNLVKIADKLILNAKDEVYEKALIPIFGTFLGLWSFVPHEYYELAKSIMTNTEAQSGLVNKMDNYHYNVQCKASEILQQANEKINIYIVVGYDIQRTPLVSAYKNTSDGTVDAKYASVGAVTANINESFSDDYVQAVSGETNHISPLKKIDASTCALPLQTWFIKDMLHSNTHNGHNEFYKLMLTSKEQFFVTTYDKYPQFMQNNIPEEKFDKIEDENAFERLKKQPSFTNFATALYELLNIIKNKILSAFNIFDCTSLS